MKYKTHDNFMLVMSILQDVKHYTASEAERMTRQIFKDIKADRQHCGHKTVEQILCEIVSKEDLF